MKRRRISGYFYILPIFVFTVFFWYLPLVISVIFSFADYNILRPLRFIGLGNYERLFHDDYFIRSVLNTLFFVAGVVPVQTILAFASAAWLVNKKRGLIRSFVEKAMFIPCIASVTVIGIVSRIMLNNPSSPLNGFLGLFGGSASGLLGSDRTALPTLMVIEILVNTGYYMIFFRNGLLEIPESYYEAARLDGASQMQIYRKIVLPLLRPVFIMVIFLGAIQGFRTFDLVYTTTGGGPGQSSLTTMVYLYMQNFKFSQIGYAMAIGNVMIVLVFILTFLQRRLIRSRESSLY